MFEVFRDGSSAQYDPNAWFTVYYTLHPSLLLNSTLGVIEYTMSTFLRVRVSSKAATDPCLFISTKGCNLQPLNKQKLSFLGMFKITLA